MAAVIFRNPNTLSLKIVVSNVTYRIRPREAFALDTANSTQTDAFLAAGFDYTQHVSFGGPALSGADSWIPHNPYGVS